MGAVRGCAGGGACAAQSQSVAPVAGLAMAMALLTRPSACLTHPSAL